MKCLMCKMREEIPSHKEELLIYRKICLGFFSQMGLVHCLMGLEGGCKSTPNSKPPKFVERDEVYLYEFYE